MHTPSHKFIAVKLETTGSVERKPFDVVKKLSMVVTPETRHGESGRELCVPYVPIITRAGTAFHSSQKVINEEVTKIIPGMKTVVK